MRKPTVLILTRGATREASVKRLLPRRAGGLETRFWRETLENSLAAASAAEFDAVVSAQSSLPGIASIPQSGASFFERLLEAEAVAHPLDGPLIMVAADVPTLSAAHLVSAAESVSADRRRVVLGPSDDGGVYLIASSEPIMHLLSSVRWNTSHVASDLSDVLSGKGFDISFLPCLRDVDTTRDLHAVARSVPPHLYRLMREIFALLRPRFSAATLRAAVGRIRTAPGLRGPPPLPV